MTDQSAGVHCFATRLRWRWSAIFVIATAGAIVPANRAAEYSASTRHFLWRVTNAPAPFYLLGSMHALRPSDYPLPDEMDRAVAASRRVIFEVNPNAKETVSLSEKLKAAGDYPNGGTIDERLSPQTLALLKRIAGMRFSEYANRKPWALAFLYLRNSGAARFESRLGVDRYIYKKTRGHAEIDGLATASEAVRTFSDMSDAESESFLVESIGFAEHARPLLTETVAAWKTGDTQQMYRLYAPRTKENGYWRWVRRHHSIWVPRIEQAIKAGQPTLVVAGALHFCGPDNLLERLRARGYHIEQL